MIGSNNSHGRIRSTVTQNFKIFDITNIFNTSHDSKVHCAWGEYTTACCKMQSVVQRYFPAINDPMQHVSEEESGLIFEGGKLSKD